MRRYLKIFLLILVFLFLKNDFVFAYKTYKSGDVVSIKGNDYYILEDSGEEQDYVYVLKEKVLTNDELYKYGKDSNGELFVNKHSGLSDEYRISDNKIAYYTSNSCYNECVDSNLGHCYEYNYVRDDCNNNYDNSDVKKVLENWKKDNFDDSELKVVDGYDIKLLDFDDLTNKLSYEYNVEVTTSGEKKEFTPTDNTSKFFINKANDWNFSWTMIADDDNLYVFTYSSKKGGTEIIVGKNYVQPALYVRKSVLDGRNNDNSNYIKYKSGQTIKLRGNYYYVLEDSGVNQDYIKLLKIAPLSTVDIYNYSLQNSNSYGVSYLKNQKCNNDDESGCSIDYDLSDVKVLVDSWAQDNFYDGELKEVDGYKARIINEDDFYNNLHYEAKKTGDVIDYFASTDETPSSFSHILFWTMVPYLKYNTVYSSFIINSFKIYSTNHVNPVINLNKCALNGTCSLNKSSNYNVGDEVIYNNQKYHVLKSSDSYSNYVTLLKDEPLSEQDIKKYYDGNETIADNFAVPFTNLNNNAYNMSIIKDIIDAWAKDEFNLNSKGKIFAKLLSTEDLVNYLGFEWGTVEGDATAFTYLATSETPEWFKGQKYDFWLMTPYEDSTEKTWFVEKGIMTNYKSSKDYKFAIRPVVNVDKCTINPNSEGCKKCNGEGKEITFVNYNEFSIGDIVQYKGDEYYTIQNSSKNQSYVTLLKKLPLTYEQVNNYGKNNNNQSVINNYVYYKQDDIDQNKKKGTFHWYYSPSAEIHKTGTCNGNYCDGEETDDHRNIFLYYYDVVIPGSAYQYDLGYGGMLYYNDSKCASFNGVDVIEHDAEACSVYSNYELSNIKTVVDNWQKNYLGNENLVEIDGYKARLLKYSEYHDFKYNFDENEDVDVIEPNEYIYWLMDSYSSNDGLKSFDGIYKKAFKENYISYPAVRPVINIDKCALENGCFTEKFNVSSCGNDSLDAPEDPDNPDNPSIVDVQNTAKFLSKLLIFSSVLLIIFGIIILSYNIYKSKKIKK